MFRTLFHAVENAHFNWARGPLDGSFTSAGAIRCFWEKFTRSTGPLKVSTGGLEASANPKGSSVSACVQFGGTAPIKVP